MANAQQILLDTKSFPPATVQEKLISWQFGLLIHWGPVALTRP